MAGVTVIYWGPVEISRGFDATFAPGITPSVFNIYTVPEGIVSALPNVADLTFYQKDSGGAPIYEFTFTDCLLESPRLMYGPQGNSLTLPILDRRWKWQFGYIDGSYNVPEPDGVTYRREKTPQELAALLLDAMHEDDFGYDVTRLPNDDNSRPHVEWQSAHPASELDTLCQSLGCIIVLNHITNKVEIWPEGTGLTSPPLPTDQPISGAGFTPVYPAQPLHVIVEAGPTIFEATFETDAVGKDTDQLHKKLDDLSYEPADGWAWPPAGYFGLITGTYIEEALTLQISDLANSTVFRCYRINGISSASVQAPWVPELLQGTDLEPAKLQDLRLFDCLARFELTNEDDGTQSLRPYPAVVYARHFPTSRDLKQQTECELWPYGFSLDTLHGIVTFPECVFLMDTGEADEAEVRLTCSFYAGKDGVFHRHFVESDTGSSVSTPTLVITRPEIQRRIIYHYDNAGALAGSPTDNEDDCNARLNYWLSHTLAQYGSQDGGTANYEALVPLSPDGLIQQITWSGGTDAGPRTIASAAQRHNRYTAPLDKQKNEFIIPKNNDKLAALDRAIKSTGDLERLNIA